MVQVKYYALKRYWTGLDWTGLDRNVVSHGRFLPYYLHTIHTTYEMSIAASFSLLDAAQKAA